MLLRRGIITGAIIARGQRDVKVQNVKIQVRAKYIINVYILSNAPSFSCG